MFEEKEEGISFWILSITSLLWGSSFSFFLSRIISTKLPFSPFSQTIPGVTPLLGQAKLLDLTDLILAIFLSTAIFLSHGYLINKFSLKKNFWATSFFVIMSVVGFLQVHFVTFSGIQLLAFFLITELGTFILFKKGEIKLSSFLKRSELAFIVCNGLAVAFYLLLIADLTATFAFFAFALFLIVPVILLWLSISSFKFRKFIFSFPGFLLIASLLFPHSLFYLLGVGIVTILTGGLLFFLKIDLLSPVFVSAIFPTVFLVALVYNPTFYLNGFDTIEEGFFLGWMQRLIEHQMLYKDVALFHPPLIPWGMFLFSQITGWSIFSERLFLHLLQIIGAIIFYFFVRSIYKNPWVTALVMTLYLGFTASLLRNNVEIRLGMGLLSLLLLFQFFRSNNRRWLFVSGVSSAIAFFVSIEIGIMATLTILIGLLIYYQKKYCFSQAITNISFFGVGFLLGALPIVLVLFFQGGLVGFYQQMFFYTSVFSKGYFNLPMERSSQLAFLHWHIVDQYLYSTGIFWEIARDILILGLIYLGTRWWKVRLLSIKEYQILVTIIFGFLVFRVALGRSDFFHMLFVWLVALVVLGFFLEKLATFKPQLFIITGIILIMVMARSFVSSGYLEALIYRYQTFGEVSQETVHLDFPRGNGAIADVNLDSIVQFATINRLVAYVKNNTLPTDTIFVYPWMPELYFYTDRQNATSIDTPFSFFTDDYQNQMISQIKMNNPKIIVYNQQFGFGSFSVESLPILNRYILENYKMVDKFGNYQILEK